MSQIIDKPVEECTLGELSRDFEGPDASLAISLGEYGLICTYNEVDDDWFCVVGYRTDDQGNYNKFYTGFIDESDLFEIARNQGGPGFFKSMGINPWIWKRTDVIHKISDLKLYLGPENLFGTPNHEEELFEIPALLEEA